jgi:hypothetical protein
MCTKVVFYVCGVLFSQLGVHGPFKPTPGGKRTGSLSEGVVGKMLQRSVSGDQDFIFR